MAAVERAVREALRLQAISFDGVKHLVLCGIEGRPARLDLQNYPHLPDTQVAITAASDYLSLLTQSVLTQTRPGSLVVEVLTEGGR